MKTSYKRDGVNIWYVLIGITLTGLVEDITHNLVHIAISIRDGFQFGLFG